jgi:hypothetical protein
MEDWEDGSSGGPETGAREDGRTEAWEDGSSGGREDGKTGARELGGRELGRSEAWKLGRPSSTAHDLIDVASYDLERPEQFE